MKLPEFKEQQGTSMDSAFQTAASRPNIKPHQAAIQRFYPKENPDDYLRLANAQSAQFSAISGAIGSVAGAIGKIYETNDNANAKAASAHVKRGMAEFVVNAKMNTQYEVTDPITGVTVRPWDSMDETLSEHMEILKEEARGKYGFSMRTNELEFDTDIEGYSAAGRIDLAEHGFKLKNDDTKAKALETVSSIDNLPELQATIGKFEQQGTFSRVDGYKLEMSKGAHILSNEYMNAFIGAGNMEIKDIEAAIRADPRADKYLEPDELDKSIANWKNDAAKDGMINLMRGVESKYGSYSFPEQMAMVERMNDIPLVDSGFATEQDRYAATYSLGRRIVTAQNQYLQQFNMSSKHTSFMEEDQKFNVDGSGKLTPEGLQWTLTQKLEPMLDQARQSGQDVNPDAFARDHIRRSAYKNSPVLPEQKLNLFTNASVSEDLMALTYKDSANWRDTMPVAMREFDAKNPALHELHLLLGSPTEAARAGISDEAIRNAISTMTVGSSDPEVRKKNQQIWSDRKADDDTVMPRTRELVLQAMGLEGVDIAESNELRYEMDSIINQKTGISPNMEFVAKSTAGVLRYYSIREEQGAMVAVKGDAFSYYRNQYGSTTDKQDQMIKNDLGRQEFEFAKFMDREEDYRNGNIIFRPTGMTTQEGDYANPSAYMLLVKDGVTTVIGDPYGASAKAMVYSNPTKAIVDIEAEYAVKTTSQNETRKEILHVLNVYGEGKTSLEDYQVSLLPDSVNETIDQLNPFVSAGLNLFSKGHQVLMNSENKTEFRMFGAINTAIDKMAIKQGLSSTQVDGLRQQAALYMQVEHGMDTQAFRAAMSKGFDPQEDSYVEGAPYMTDEQAGEINIAP